LSTDKIPSSTTVDEWVSALRWHPDLARDLRVCRALITAERRTKRLWLQGQVVWTPLSATMWPGKPLFPLPTSDRMPVVMTEAWLSLRYKPLWDNAPAFPEAALQPALSAAVEAGAWPPAAAVIRQAVAANSAVHEQAGFVRADVFADVAEVRCPDGVRRARDTPRARAWPEDLPQWPAIVLTITQDATLLDAIEKLKSAWETITPLLNPPIGARPGKQAQGQNPEFGHHVTLYRLYRSWANTRTAQGMEPTLTGFAKALSRRLLPVQQRAIELHKARPGPLSERLAWLIAVSPGSTEYLAKKLRETVLPVLAPDPKIAPLHDFLER